MNKRIIVPKDRTFERTQGCWNCVHSSSAKEWWTKQRLLDLGKALAIAQESPQGENHLKVRNIREMVDKIDTAVAQNALIRCVKGTTPTGAPVGDLTPHNYLCDRWTAVQGASIARDIGKTDKLPEELAEDLDGKTLDLHGILSKKLVD